MKAIPSDTKIDQVIVLKKERVMQLLQESRVIKSYDIALGFDPIGHKEVEGDGKTPEGTYIINDKNPNSSFFLNLGISYPNEQDKLANNNPGGDIKIHGLRNGYGFIGKLHLLKDWTHGCIAVTNKEIREIYDHVDIGTPIHILP